MPPPRPPATRLLPISLRLRLTLWYGALVLLVLLGFTGFAYLEMRTALYAGVDTALEDRAAQIAAVTTITESGVQFSSDGAPSGLGDGGVFVFDRRGTPLAPTRVAGAGARADLEAVRRAVGGGASWSSTSGNLRLYTTQVRDDANQAFIIQVAGPRGGADATLGRVLTALLLAVPILVLVSGAGGAFLAGRALRPIDRITRTARLIGAGDLHERLGLPPRDDEVGRLASTFDAMLDRLEGTFRRQRQFTADASHELRTPLTILQGEVEVALRRRRTVEAYEATLGTVQEQVEGMTGIVEDLLALARADSGQVEIDRELVELDDLVRRAAAQAQPLFDAKGLRLALQVEPGILVIGDPSALTRVVANLLGNAARYTDRGGARLALASGEGWAHLVIGDTGIGIAPEHLERIFERFYRADKARSRTAGGSGLGLAIARWVVEAHGGTIEAESEMGGGSVFRVALPLVGSDARGPGRTAGRG